LSGKLNTGKFTGVELPDPKRDEFSKTYEDVMEELGKYRDGCEAESSKSALACGCETHDEHEKKPRVKRSS
jgi:hypothetical protein